MNSKQKARLEAAGYEFLTVTEFLGLTPEEEVLVEIRLALGNLLRQYRKEAKVRQVDVAQKAKTTQSRIARVEAAASSVSTDAMLLAMVAAGVPVRKIGETIAGVKVAGQPRIDD